MVNAELETYPAIATRPTGAEVLLAFALWSALFAVLALAGASWLAGGLSIAAIGAGLAYAIAMMRAGAALWRGYLHARLGACNVVTQFRAALVAVLGVAIVTPSLMQSAPYTIFAIALIALCLDGVDGWLARRSGLSSPFGARFDMEVDAALGAVLSLIVLRSGIAGSEIVVLGFMRYAFLAAGLVLPWLNRPLPDSFLRKAICVVQISALCILLLPFISAPVSGIIAITASVLLVVSFARDVIWLARQ